METSIATRRTFLKVAGLTAASLFLPGCRSNAGLHGGDPQDDSFFFIQMADPQLFWGPADLWQTAIDHANRLKPAFVVVCGDLINNAGEQEKLDLAEDERRTAAYRKIADGLDRKIPLYNVAGNHDVCNKPTQATYSWYRERFGKLWYSFNCGKCLFIVLESNILKNPAGSPQSAEEQMAWLRKTLDEADSRAFNHRIVFMHHPMCLATVDEDEQYFTMPRQRRLELLELFGDHRVAAVFSGHYHRNAYVEDGRLELVTTSSTGKPLGSDPVGFRIVKVHRDRIEHTYYGYENMPANIDMIAGARGLFRSHLLCSTFPEAP